MAGGELMIAAIERYLATGRAAGYSLSNVEYRLRSFARFAADHQQTHVRRSVTSECMRCSVDC